MAGLQLKHIYKVYSNGAKAVNDFCMDIEDKEFIVFVGPSGCGKSTTLRMIAGLEEITSGELYIDGKLVNDAEPKDRDIAMVFQNYALYPHMSVYKNMGFGLKLRKVPKEQIKIKVGGASAVLGITEYLERRPAAMSGGQRQRVALGRAIVREPKVFLLDEPLSNLDAKLRTQMRSELSKLHKRLQTTFIYVTHDQVEAMTMGTRIVVMKDGFIQQIDTPSNLYRFPCNKFVAGFIGTPQMNFYKGRIKKEGENVRITFDNTEVNGTVPAKFFAKADERYFDGERQVIIGLRSEHMSVDASAYPFKAKCRVSYVEELGVDSQVYADFALGENETDMDSETKVIVKAPPCSNYKLDDVIEISLDMAHAHLFDAETERTIAPRIPEETSAIVTVAGGVLNILGGKLALPPAINLADGEYRIVIPAEAMSFGGEIGVKVVGEEDVDGRRLVEVVAGGKTLFVLAKEGQSAEGGLSIELKKCTFMRGGEAAVSPMPAENVLEGRLVKHKKTKTAPKHYTFEIGGYGYPCSEEIAERLLDTAGKHILKQTLVFRFPPEAARYSQDGAPAELVRALNYGDCVYAEAKVDGVSVFVACDEEPPVSGNITIDLESAGIFNKQTGIRIV